jgi:hypothetical protein
MFAMLLGTYLDLYFVGKNLYEFPVRPFPKLFSINIAFTLVILPLLTCIYLYIADKMTRLGRFVFTFFLSALVPFVEKLSVHLGLLNHSEHWSNYYSFIGYFIYLVVTWRIFNLLKRMSDK